MAKCPAGEPYKPTKTAPMAQKSQNKGALPKPKARPLPGRKG